MGKDIWNPWHGCRKCSDGCRNCYMFAMDAWRERPEWSSSVFRTGKFRLPVMKDRHRQFKLKPGWRMRVNMTSDTFIEEASEWMPEFWSLIRQRPDIIFWLLTKRPERILESLPDDWGAGYENVSLNISVENQTAFDKRWPMFSQIPIKHKGICCAPLIGPVILEPALESGQIEEILAGGENYNDPRICDYAWVYSLSKQCKAHHVNFCWYESGTRFQKDGQIRIWPKKADQGAIAYLSGLNHKFYDIPYKLYHPDDHHQLTPSQLWQKTYNLNHCAFCANRMLCNGCLDCGDCCQTPVHVTLEQLWAAEDWLIQNNPPLVYQTYDIKRM